MLYICQQIEEFYNEGKTLKKSGLENSKSQKHFEEIKVNFKKYADLYVLLNWDKQTEFIIYDWLKNYADDENNNMTLLSYFSKIDSNLKEKELDEGYSNIFDISEYGEGYELDTVKYPEVFCPGPLVYRLRTYGNLFQTYIPERSTYKTRSMRYEKLLGEGAFGRVMLVTDKETGRPYAIKEVKIFNQAQEDELYDEFSLNRMFHHPNIIR